MCFVHQMTKIGYNGDLLMFNLQNRETQTVCLRIVYADKEKSTCDFS